MSAITKALLKNSCHPQETDVADARRYYMLQDGTLHPSVGFGTYKIGFIPLSTTIPAKVDRPTKDVVLEAINAGYRLFDCAEYYQNEAGIGEAIRESKVPREDILIVSKVWNSTMFEGDAAIRATVKKQLRQLGTDYIDIYLIHWPVVAKIPGDIPVHVEAYLTLEKLVAEGCIKYLGISNYTIQDYKALKQHMSISPICNQLEISPFLYRSKTLEFFRSEGLLLHAYRTLRQGWEMDNPVLLKIAKKYHTDVAQILGRWCIQHGFVFLPKSQKKLRIESNIGIFHFNLSRDEMTILDGLTTADSLEQFRAKYEDCIVRDTPLQGKLEELQFPGWRGSNLPNNAHDARDMD